jgi:hypothetical protein
MSFLAPQHPRCDRPLPLTRKLPVGRGSAPASTGAASRRYMLPLNTRPLRVRLTLPNACVIIPPRAVVCNRHSPDCQRKIETSPVRVGCRGQLESQGARRHDHSYLDTVAIASHFRKLSTILDEHCSLQTSCANLLGIVLPSATLPMITSPFSSQGRESSC